MLGQIVKIIVDRPLGSCHPEYPALRYPINYGFVPGTLAPDGEEQDAYLMGVNHPVTEYIGKVIAVIRRADDLEEKWVVAPEGFSFSEEEIQKQTYFQEQFFRTEIIIEPENEG